MKIVQEVRILFEVPDGDPGEEGYRALQSNLPTAHPYDTYKVLDWEQGDCCLEEEAPLQ